LVRGDTHHAAWSQPPNRPLRPAALTEWFSTWNGPIITEGARPAIGVDGDIACAWSLWRMCGRKISGELVDMWYCNSLC
jgi:ketosteroid isomerase-like protein